MRMGEEGTARLARVVAPSYPHHVTQQRGNGRQRVFFQAGNDALYRDLREETWSIPYFRR
jgi:putative transposase